MTNKIQTQNNPALPTVRHAFTGKLPQDHAILFNGPGRTRQSFKDECDINVIMSMYQQTGVIDFVTQHQAQYLDVTGHDFTQAANTVAAAQSMFHELPSGLRARFDNNPAAFLDFVHNDANRKEAEALGLLKPPPVGQTNGPDITPNSPPKTIANPASGTVPT